VGNLVRNYSPHLNTRSAPPTTELRKVLGMAGKEMLEKFLRKWRKKREVDGGGVQAIDEVCHFHCGVLCSVRRTWRG